MYKSVAASTIFLIFSLLIIFLMFQQNIYLNTYLKLISETLNIRLEIFEPLVLLILFIIIVVSAFILIRGVVKGVAEKVM